MKLLKRIIWSKLFWRILFSVSFGLCFGFLSLIPFFVLFAICGGEMIAFVSGSLEIDADTVLNSLIVQDYAYMLMKYMVGSAAIVGVLVAMASFPSQWPSEGKSDRKGGSDLKGATKKVIDVSEKINLPTNILEHIVESIITTVPTKCIYIFGSYARGEETPQSDIDIYVVTNKNECDKLDFSAMADVGMALLWLKEPKDIFCLSENEFIKRSQRATGLERVVLGEGIKIYEG